MRYLKVASLLVAFTAATAPIVRAQPTSNPTSIPEWLLSDMAKNIGTWLTDNTAYQDQNEPYSHYAITWAWATGRSSIRGFLTGAVDDHPADTIWEMRRYWHPAEQRVAVFQIARDGTVGFGLEDPPLGDTIRVSQQFNDPTTGAAFVIGHEAVHRDAVRFVRSYAVDERGAWVLRRSYRWEKQ